MTPLIKPTSIAVRHLPAGLSLAAMIAVVPLAAGKAPNPLRQEPTGREFPTAEDRRPRLGAADAQDRDRDSSVWRGGLSLSAADPIHARPRRC
jgi:hypothetical protein